jgi:seryl-tRNA synthetase
VQQTIVSFDGHRLIDPCTDEADTRRLLKRRAYDHMLAQVLEAMAKRRTTRTELAGQRELLQRKSAALQKAGWSFEAGSGKGPSDAAALESELARIEEEIGTLGPDEATLDAHLDLLAEALAAPAKRLWVEERSMILDHRNVLRMQADSVARELQLRELHDARGTRVVALLLDIDPALLPRTDFFAAARRYTG